MDSAPTWQPPESEQGHLDDHAVPEDLVVIHQLIELDQAAKE